MQTLRISTDKAELDVPLIHRFLSEQSSWAIGIPLAVVRRSIEHSLCFGGFLDASQVAFARVVSDYATFAYLMDVFVLPDFRGHGHGKTMMQAVVSHQRLQGLRRFMLATSTAHDLYARFDFWPVSKPQSFMERHSPDVYLSNV
jgi:GNAT superfamily N-acetyltransferase